MRDKFNRTIEFGFLRQMLIVPKVPRVPSVPLKKRKPKSKTRT
jgi:hypothetical protein